MEISQEEKLRILKKYNLFVDNYKKLDLVDSDKFTFNTNFNLNKKSIYVSLNGPDDAYLALRRIALMNLAMKCDFDYDNDILGLQKNKTLDSLMESLTGQEIMELASLSILGGYSPTSLESVNLTFFIRNISLNCSHQIVRHRLFGFSQLSYRANLKKNKFITIPETISDGPENDFKTRFKNISDMATELYEDMCIKGVPLEDARYILPTGINTHVVMTGNYRALQDFYSQRSCEYCSQWEINEVANQIRASVFKWNKMFGRGLIKPCNKADKCMNKSNMYEPCDEYNRMEGYDYVYKKDVERL